VIEDILVPMLIIILGELAVAGLAYVALKRA
jgi:hypothetical protein